MTDEIDRKNWPVPDDLFNYQGILDKKPYLAMTGVRKKGEKGFKITTPPKPPPPHIIYNGPGPGRCSECAQPVNAPQGACVVCVCGAQFGGCG